MIIKKRSAPTAAIISKLMDCFVLTTTIVVVFLAKMGCPFEPRRWHVGCAHMHSYVSSVQCCERVSTHTPLCSHVISSHGLISISHCFPRHPVVHKHVKSFISSTHVALFLHGLSAQSSIFMLQLEPSQPTKHSHK